MEEVWQKSGYYVVVFAWRCWKFGVGTMKGWKNHQTG
jgi:hypothetical protein